MTASRSTPAATHPFSAEAEQAVLGGLMQRADLLPVVCQHLAPGDFWLSANGRLFALMLTMDAKGEAVDIVTVPERVLRSGDANAYGGLAYVLGLPDAISSVANLDHYARIVQEKAAARRLMDLGADLAAMSAAEDPDLQEKAGAVVAEIIGSLTSSAKKGPPLTVTEVLERVRAKRERGIASAETLSTGLMALDGALGGGLPLRQVTMLAGHPSHGKSALALQIVGNVSTRFTGDIAAASRYGADLSTIPGVGVFSLEMDAERVLDRLIGAQCGVDHKAAARGTMSAVERIRWDDAADRFVGAPLFIEDARRMTAAEIRARALYMHHRLQAQGFAGLRLLVLDYIQKITPANPKQPRHEAVAEMSEAMYELTASLGCASLILAQPSRKALDTSDPRPKLWHLAESAYLERDIDVAMMVFWPSKLDDAMRRTSEVHRYEVEIAKNRDGQSGGTPLVHYTPRGMQFRDASDDEIGGWASAAKARREAAKARPKAAAGPKKTRERAGAMPAHPDDDE